MTQGAPPGNPGPVPPKGSVIKYKSELRKAIKRNAHEHEVNFLNITAMLDIMTIILVFLLKTLGESSAAVPQSDDLRLPNSVIKTQPHQEGVVLGGGLESLELAFGCRGSRFLDEFSDALR